MTIEPWGSWAEWPCQTGRVPVLFLFPNRLERKAFLPKSWKMRWKGLSKCSSSEGLWNIGGPVEVGSKPNSPGPWEK